MSCAHGSTRPPSTAWSRSTTTIRSDAVSTNPTPSPADAFTTAAKSDQDDGSCTDANRPSVRNGTFRDEYRTHRGRPVNSAGTRAACSAATRSRSMRRRSRYAACLHGDEQNRASPLASKGIGPAQRSHAVRQVVEDMPPFYGARVTDTAA